jgi:hypothetical protein
MRRGSGGWRQDRVCRYQIAGDVRGRSSGLDGEPTYGRASRASASRLSCSLMKLEVWISRKIATSTKNAIYSAAVCEVSDAWDILFERGFALEMLETCESAMIAEKAAQSV